MSRNSDQNLYSSLEILLSPKISSMSELLLKGFQTKGLTMFSKVIVLLMCLSTAPNVFAAKTGAGSGGGGDLKLNKTSGEIISIADPLALKEIPFKRIRLPKDMDIYLADLKHILGIYKFSFSRFDLLVNEANVDYRLVENLPSLDICNERLQYQENQDENIHIAQAACTLGNITWIKKEFYDRFKGPELNKELALLLLHEGLRRVPSMTNDDLTSITNGIRYAQATIISQGKGKLAPLTPEKKELLQTMMEAIMFNGLDRSGNEEVQISEAKMKLDSITLTDFGGLVSVDASVDSSAIIGIGASIQGASKVGKNVVIVGSYFHGSYDSENYAWTKLLTDRNATTVTINESNTVVIHDNYKLIGSGFVYNDKTHLGKK